MQWLQVVSALAIVFGLLALLYWMGSRAGLGPHRAGRRIEVLERHALGDKRSLLLIRVGGETFLVGSTSQTISMISSVSAEAGVEESDDASVERSNHSFRQVLEMLR